MLIIRTNGSKDLIGRTGLVRKPFDKSHFFASYLIRYRVISLDVAIWLSTMWDASSNRRNIERIAATSAGQYNVSVGSLNKIPLPLPPLAEQRRIVAEVERRLSVVAEMEAAVTANLARAERLRQAVLAKAFSGQLVPQDPADKPAERLLERVKAERATRLHNKELNRKSRRARASKRFRGAFDSVAMQQLREKYKSQPDFRVPKIVFLDRSDELAGEREYLQSLLLSAPETKRADWIGRLLSDDDEQHLGAWFEVMLYGWLQEIGQVAVEPQVEGNLPDFSLSTDVWRVMIEARACLIDQPEREHEKHVSEVLWALGQVRKPYLVTIKQLVLEGALEAERLIDEVSQWLSHFSEEPFSFQDMHGNKVVLISQRHPQLEKVATLGPTTVEWVKPKSLKAPLREKAGQHKALRKAGHPYVLAVFLESPKLSAEEVAEAWFGKTQVVIDLETDQVIEETIDKSGLHFFGAEIRHKTVSGTLVFRARFNASSQRHELRAWYIQNPFAVVPIAVNIFPVEAAFVVLRQDMVGYSMGWRRALDAK